MYYINITYKNGKRETLDQRRTPSMAIAVRQEYRRAYSGLYDRITVETRPVVTEPEINRYRSLDERDYY